MTLRAARNILMVLGPLALLVLFVQGIDSRATIISAYTRSLPLSAAVQSIQGGLGGQPSGLSGATQLVPNAPPAAAQLAAFNAGSALQESAAAGRVEFFRRAMPGGGELAYFVVRLDDQVHVQLINADGAVPGSDESGDTIWLDRQQHLATVAEMAAAPYAALDGMELLGAMAFGFHGAVRTSNEGSVVINGSIHRVNAGRAALCITPGLRALIDRFDAQGLQGCQQAVGGGPVILWQGKIANPAVTVPTDEFIPFNPLGEDFVQLDWRIKIYSGTYPKTAVCAGDLPGGTAYLVLANATGINGVELARALRDMGCTSALGGDDDTSTQAVWRGHPVWPREVREVPDAIAVYARP